MSRSQRLLSLIQILRRHRFPVSGNTLAGELNISLRTLYRDIATLQEQGADIQGEAGVGYVLRPGFMLPPLMFSEEELEALVLGMRWVSRMTDESLGASARNALAKISSVLPDDMKDSLEANTLLIGQRTSEETGGINSADLRKCIREESKIEIRYLDAQNNETTRIIWPFAIGYFENVKMLVGWCELRAGYRHFRADKIIEFRMIGQRYPRRRQVLLKEWYMQSGIKPQ
ncbi:YafY family protein [Microvirga sp. W0021]|uniref:YafY family protein n=1 Tax=Hohaiivirga grylli TaxID=3133970 RepID=A0ABV0BIQ1_9HYPH